MLNLRYKFWMLEEDIVSLNVGNNVVFINFYSFFNLNLDLKKIRLILDLEFYFYYLGCLENVVLFI